MTEGSRALGFEVLDSQARNEAQAASRALLQCVRVSVQSPVETHSQILHLMLVKRSTSYCFADLASMKGAFGSWALDLDQGMEKPKVMEPGPKPCVRGRKSDVYRTLNSKLSPSPPNPMPH